MKASVSICTWAKIWSLSQAFMRLQYILKFEQLWLLFGSLWLKSLLDSLLLWSFLIPRWMSSLPPWTFVPIYDWRYIPISFDAKELQICSCRCNINLHMRTAEKKQKNKNKCASYIPMYVRIVSCYKFHKLNRTCPVLCNKEYEFIYFASPWHVIECSISYLATILFRQLRNQCYAENTRIVCTKSGLRIRRLPSENHDFLFEKLI
jgi:hypothetical protein